MKTNEKSPQKLAISAHSETENLQSSENLDNFAKILYINPMSDFGFKKIFGVEKIMIGFLNDLIQPESPIEKITFLDKEKLPDNKSQRGVVYDLLCRTEDDREFLVEMQNAPQEKFSDRVIYYLSRSIAPQGQKGKVDGHDWDYELRAIYGVFLLNFHLNDHERLKLRTLRLTVKENNHKVFSDKLNAYIIELPCIKGMKEEDCKTKLDCWMYNLYNMETTTKPLAFQDVMPVFKEVASQAEFNSMSPEEQRRYMYALDEYRSNKAAWDYSIKRSIQKGLQEGMQKGMQEGMQKGMQEGIQKGKLEERYKNARALKAIDVPVEKIAKALGLSVEEIEML